MAPIAVISFLALLALVLSFNRHQRKQRTQRFQELAQTLEGGHFRLREDFFHGLHGTCVSGKLDGFKLQFEVDVVGRGKNQTTYYEFKVYVPSSLVRVSISKANPLNSFGAWLGLVEDKEIGKPRIDKKYILQGGQGDLERLFQHISAERAIDALIRDGFDDICMDYGVITVREPYAYIDDSNLVRIAEHLVVLAKLCTREKVKIKKFGDQEQFAWTAGGEDVLCPFCRDSFDIERDALSSCDTCRTLHHRECFKEAGGCTIFGCDGEPKNLRLRKSGARRVKRGRIKVKGKRSHGR